MHVPKAHSPGLKEVLVLYYLKHFAPDQAHNFRLLIIHHIITLVYTMESVCTHSSGLRSPQQLDDWLVMTETVSDLCHYSDLIFFVVPLCGEVRPLAKANDRVLCMLIGMVESTLCRLLD